MKFFFPILLCFSLCVGMEPENKIVYRDMPPIKRRSGEEVITVLSNKEAIAHYLDTKDEKVNSLNVSTDTEDSIPTRHHHRRMAISNGVTALLATCVTAGVTLAIHFSSKCPNPPTGTP